MSASEGAASDPPTSSCAPVRGSRDHSGERVGGEFETREATIPRDPEPEKDHRRADDDLQPDENDVEDDLHGRNSSDAASLTSARES